MDLHNHHHRQCLIEILLMIQERENISRASCLLFPSCLFFLITSRLCEPTAQSSLRTTPTSCARACSLWTTAETRVQTCLHCRAAASEVLAIKNKIYAFEVQMAQCHPSTLIVDKEAARKSLSCGGRKKRRSQRGCFPIIQQSTTLPCQGRKKGRKRAAEGM